MYVGLGVSHQEISQRAVDWFMGLKGLHIEYWKGEKIVHPRPGKNRRRPFIRSLSELHQEVLGLIAC
jgi:hypothetical protein